MLSAESDRPVITEDESYRPSLPEKAERVFRISLGPYRWDAMVWRLRIRDTGTILYKVSASEGHSAYGLTLNEALNDIASIMKRELSCAQDAKTVSFKDIRSYLDPADAAREEIKIAQARSSKSFIARIFGF